MKFLLITGFTAGLLGVALGAFGAHGLKNVLESTGKADIFETAAKYQMYHALLLVASGILFRSLGSDWFMYAGYVIIPGMLIFSGTLYYISISGNPFLGRFTPIGGLLLMAGWLFNIIGVLKSTT